MSSVFRQSQELNNDVKRNSFDYSFTNNLTTKLGQITPVFFADMLPSTGLKINPRMAWNFMPMLFPVQTPVRAYMHFFKVRKRTLWKDFMDYFGKTPKSKSIVKPYIDVDNPLVFANSLKTGSLGDYLGLPTTVVGSFANAVTLQSSSNSIAFGPSAPTASVQGVANTLYGGNNIMNNYPLVPNSAEVRALASTRSTLQSYWCGFGYDFSDYIGASSPDFLRDLSLDLSSFYDVIPAYTRLHVYFSRTVTVNDNHVNEIIPNSVLADIPADGASVSSPFVYVNDVSNSKLLIKFNSNITSSDLETWFAKYQSYGSDSSANDLQINFVFRFDCDSNLVGFTQPNSFSTDGCLFYDGTLITKSYSVLHTFSDDSDVDITFSRGYSKPVLNLSQMSTDLSLKEVEYLNNAYFGSKTGTDDKIKLDAMPFRAYESIYNCFYRNILNNPYKPDGVTPEYNEFIPTRDGGIDSNVYKLHHRNWDDDFLTTAIQNPQSGEFPVVVGLTNLGEGMALAIRDEDGNNYHVQAVLSSDGKTISKFEVTDLPKSQIISTPSAFIDMANSGISIPDLRCANALQRWLELNARKGLRFKDLVKGRFDTDIRFDELNMPEFVGGFSASLNMQAVDQTYSTQRVGSFDQVLGSYAGQGSIYGDSKNDITVFADEPCYLIGLVSIVPQACYSQLLPKHFTYRDILDEFSPEFNHIGYQPITYAEVCPNQAYLDPQTKLKDIFGYQRAWYEYISRVDEVHGDFRTSLRDFLINRVFNKRPELSESFLLVDQNQVNDVFSVIDDSDKILGQCYFDCSVIHPISKFGTPKLEA